jgi:hypothetical protein
MTTSEALPSVRDETGSLLAALGVSRDLVAGGALEVRSPITGEVVARVKETDAAGVEAAIAASYEAFHAFRKVPAPKRGELVRLLGEELRVAKTALGRLVTIETGKIVSEGLGEVQEMIDICDFAVGLSRQLYGLTIASERLDHRMMETWHPLGVTGIITAFNFPVAVWSWNAALTLVCGNSLVWKPSEKTPLSALAVQALFERAAAKMGNVPAKLSNVLIGGRAIGDLLVDHRMVPLVSATGSTAMGRAVGPRLAARFARSILELGGNNAAIVCFSADLDLALRAIAFAAMGTAGQISLYGIEFLRRIGETLEVNGDQPDIQLHEGGYLFLATEESRQILKENHALQTKLGADILFLEPLDLVGRFPWLSVGGLSAGCWGRTGEGWLDGYGLMWAFRRKAQALGVIYRSAQATGVERMGDRVTAVLLDEGTRIACGAVVNAAGAGGPAIARAAGLEIPVHNKKAHDF